MRKIFNISFKKDKTSKGSFLGAYMPQEIGHYLILYVTAFQMTKSDLIKQQIKKWYEKHIHLYPEEELISDIVRTCKNHWDVEKVQNLYEGNELDIQFKNFKKDLSEILRNKGLSESHIKDIKEKLSK